MPYKPCKDHHGKRFPSIQSMCDYYHIPRSLYLTRVRNGWSRKECLLGRKGEEASVGGRRLKPCTDHLGNQFASLTDMCNHYGIAVQTYYSRKRNGYDLETILTTKERLLDPSKTQYKKRWFDHKGKEFHTLSELCAHYNISISTYRKKLLAGYPLKQILTEPNITNGRISRIECTDYLGNHFPSEADMCKYHGIKYTTFKRRKRMGWTGKALLEKPKKTNHSRGCKDHKGNEFPNLNKMCGFYKISTATYYSRIKMGWSLRKTLTTPTKSQSLANGYQKATTPCKDHKGKKYISVVAMCDAYGVNPGTFIYRRKHGISLKDALVPDENYRKKRCTDHLGNEYPSMAAMGRQYNLNPHAIVYRLQSGMSLEEALTTPTPRQRKKRSGKHQKK